MLRNSVHDRESSLVARKNGRQCLHAGLGPAQAQVANDSIPTLGSLKSRAGNAMAETQEESRLPASTPPHTRKNLPWLWMTVTGGGLFVFGLVAGLLWHRDSLAAKAPQDNDAKALAPLWSPFVQKSRPVILAYSNPVLLMDNAHRRKVKLLLLPTAQAIKTLKQNPNETNAILHVTC